MTPMVDLGFLLITFFIFTSSMMDMKALKLSMPADGKPTTQPESASITLLLSGSRQVYYYEGQWEDALENKRIQKTSYHSYEGIGKIIREKIRTLNHKRNELMLIIKPDDAASYGDVIDALDEVTINDLKRYALIHRQQQKKLFCCGKAVDNCFRLFLQE
jgi:biopolymer transport protein ExbD